MSEGIAILTTNVNGRDVQKAVSPRMSAAEFVRHESTAAAEKYGRPVPFYTVDYDFVLVPGETRSDVVFSAGRA